MAIATAPTTTQIRATDALDAGAVATLRVLHADGCLQINARYERDERSGIQLTHGVQRTDISTTLENACMAVWGGDDTNYRALLRWLKGVSREATIDFARYPRAAGRITIDLLSGRLAHAVHSSPFCGELIGHAERHLYPERRGEAAVIWPGLLHGGETLSTAPPAW
jgi:hypothetical protein